MYDLGHYTQEHRRELEGLLESQAWQTAVSSGLVEEVKAGRIEPGKTISYIDNAVKQLLEFNEERVRTLIAQGCRDREHLFGELAKWPEDLEGKNPILSFMGFNLTAACDFDPKCIYCNQPWVESSVGLDGWKEVIEAVTANNNREGPYIYFTGGEPLLLGEDIWGENGLIRFASERGAAVNVNTNALKLTPEVALRFIKAGLSKLHISLDSPDRDLQNYLFGADRYDKVLEGIYNVQLARDVIGVSYPVIHINCVLTNRNLDGFPQLFSFLLGKRKRVTDSSNPLYGDLFAHIIPVGGDSNIELRPSAEEFRRFYEQKWDEVCELWDAYQGDLGIPKDERRPLIGYFGNPFIRIDHKGGLDAYVKASEEGRYGKLALREYCYVAPTQASFTPDGTQYRCGSHAVRHALPVGSIEDGIFANIREGIAGLKDLPQEEHCYGCALATLWINQSVESRLKETLDSVLGEKESGS